MFATKNKLIMLAIVALAGVALAQGASPTDSVGALIASIGKSVGDLVNSVGTTASGVTSALLTFTDSTGRFVFALVADTTTTLGTALSGTVGPVIVTVTTGTAATVQSSFAGTVTVVGSIIDPATNLVVGTVVTLDASTNVGVSVDDSGVGVGTTFTASTSVSANLAITEIVDATGAVSATIVADTTTQVGQMVAGQNGPFVVAVSANSYTNLNAAFNGDLVVAGSASITAGSAVTVTLTTFVEASS